jgi:hypothetical protein
MVLYACSPSYSGGRERRPHPKKKVKAKRTEDVAQMVEHLPSKCKALGLVSKEYIQKSHAKNWF